MKNKQLNELEESTVQEILKGKVSYYWESDDCFPALEVFMQDNKENIVNDIEELNKKLQNHKASMDKISENNYYRIVTYVDPSTTITELENIAEIMSNYGESEWKDV